MPTLKAGWALFGKRPGSFDDYAVIAASSWPFDANQFQQIISGYSPGNPPASREASVDALPWVSFSTATLHGTTFVGVAVRDWSDHTDGTNRPIAFTRYFCIRLDEIGDASATFTDFYYAVRDIKLPWEVSDPLAGGPLQLPLPAHDPAAVAETVEAAGLERAAAAAAALFEGPVAVLSGTTDVAERLRFLDAVAALLPLGARTWLSAGSWADSGAKHRLLLAFTQRGRDGDRRVTERGDYDDPQDQGAQRYHRELIRLSRARGTAAVVGHLAAMASHCKQHANDAIDALADFDLAGDVLRRAQDKSLQPRHVRRLGTVRRFGDLSREDREFVLSRYLLVAQTDDLAADLELLAQQWSPGLNPHLVHVAWQRLWQDRWPVADLARFATLADRVGAREAFMDVLIPRDSDSTRPSTGLAIAAAFVTHLDTTPPYSEQLLPTIGQAPTLAVAVLQRCLTTNLSEATNWLHRLERSARSHPASRPWTAVAMPFKVALLDEPGVVDPTEITALARLDPSVVHDLVSACRKGHPDQLEHLMRGVLPWLHQQVLKPYEWQQQKWAVELAQLELKDDGQQAEVDLLLYRLGRNPARDPVQAAHDGGVPRTQYVDSFVTHVWEADLSDDGRVRLVHTLARRLGSGWSSPESRLEAVLDLLWKVSHSKDGTRAWVTNSLLDAIVREIQNQAELLDHPAFAQWLRDYPKLERRVPRARLHRISEDTSVADAADSIVQSLMSGRTEADVIAVLTTSGYRPSPDKVCDLLQSITTGLRTKGCPGFSVDFGRQIIATSIGDTSAEGTRLADTLVLQVMLRILLLQEIASRGDSAMQRALLQRLDKLELAYQLLGDALALVDPQRNHPSISKKVFDRLTGKSRRQPEAADSETGAHEADEQR